MATVHFPHQDQAAKYQDQIRNWVRGNVSLCARSLFVFDEVDKMPNGVLDGIRAFLDYIEAVDKVDYRWLIILVMILWPLLFGIVYQTGYCNELIEIYC